MNSRRHPRRAFLAASSAALAGTLTANHAPTAKSASQPVAQAGLSLPPRDLRYCLNTSTINRSEVPIREQLKIAAAAGYDAIEIWLRDIDKFTAEGGKLADLAKEIRDLGLGVDSAIAFGNWIVDDGVKRQAGLEQCKRDMEIVRTLGGRRMAAPPAGATAEAGLDLNAAADRYRALLEVGAAIEVVPQLELWGFSKNVSTLAEVLYIAAAAQHPDACLLLDIYHLYKGGSDFSNVGLIPAQKLYCLHMNDYPAVPDRENIGDADRVYPGDGIAPIDNILRTLIASGFTGTLSLELFNRTYWKLPAADVAKTGIEKMKACVERAMATT